MADFPKWLQRLIDMKPEQLKAAGWTPEEVDEAKNQVLMQADYTTKLQAIKPLRDLVEKYGENVDWAQAAEWYGWARSDYPKFKAAYEQMERDLSAARAAGTTGTATNGDGTAPRARRGARRFTTAVEDVFTNTARLYDLGNEVADVTAEEILGLLPGQLDDWWQKKTGPLVQDVADRSMATVLELVRPLWEARLKDTGLSLDDILKAAAAEKSRDFGKVLTSELKRVDDLKRKGFDEGHARGVEEGKGTTGGTLTASGGTPAAKPPAEPSAPAGSGRPFWRPVPENPRPKTKEELRDRVLTTVAAKHGGRLPM